MEDTKEIILQDARNYMKSNKIATFNTYETFKKRAVAGGFYDLVPLLARILKI